jgi:hypothetical protein
MVATAVVGEVQRILKQLRDERGEFSLAMLYSSFEAGEGGWNLIVSARWVDEMGVSAARDLVVKCLSRSLSEENKPQISRVTVLNTNDQFVVALTSLVSVTNGVVMINNSTFGGVHIPRGFLFYSRGAVPAETQ